MHEIPPELERRLRAMGISEELLEEGRRTGSIDGVSILPSPLSVALGEERAALQAEIEQDDRDLLELEMDVDRDGDGFIGSHPRRCAVVAGTGPEPHPVGPVASTAEDVTPTRNPPRGPFVQGADTSRTLPIASAIAVGALVIVAIMVLR
ncbi:MAG: hypothetical protein JWM86_2051 [Thermoleophilia bacterium]|nr:hypothetical protein [Thermoleophilia bacterium]